MRRPYARRRLTALAVVSATVIVIVAVVVPGFQGAVHRLTLPLAHQDIIRQQAHEKHLEPALIAAVIYAESRFREQVSSAGAVGLMQLLPSTALAIAQRSGGRRFTTADLATPQLNIAYGSYYLRILVDHYNGSVTLAIAAYNAGQNNVDRWLAQARTAGHALTLERIPFAETRGYVRSVLEARRRYLDTYGPQLDRG